MDINPVKNKFSNPYYLLLLPIYFVLHGFTQYYPLVLPGQAALLLLKYIPAILILTALFFLFFRMWRTAIMFSFFVSFLYIFFGAIHDWMKTWLDNTFLVKYIFILPAGTIIFILLAFYLRKNKPVFFKLSFYFNILLIILIAADIVLLASKINKDASEVEVVNTSSLLPCKTCDKPDIYLIIADEYAGKKQLEDVFSFDNSEFENQLRERGFYVIDSSISNYSHTSYSMASLLEMNLLKDIDTNSRSFNNHRLSLKAINDNQLLDFLKVNDYDLKNYSIFQVGGQLPFEKTHFFKTGTDLVTGQTLLSRINRDIRFNLVTKLKYKSDEQWIIEEELRANEGLFERSMQEASAVSEKPRFVYTHLLMPHYPYYFDRNGKRNSLTLVDSEKYNPQKYIEYLQYANKKFILLIDEILLNSEKPSVIILMSDYGFRGDSSKRKYQFMTLNSIYLPGGQYEGFYKGMSNVNQFRVLLNTIFDKKLPLRKDTSIYIK